jgi:hypothetical protein
MTLQAAKESFKRYVDHKIPTGDFLRSVLENNLMEAVGRADDSSYTNLKEICQFVYMDLPSNCWGSPEIVRNWLRGRV